MFNSQIPWAAEKLFQIFVLVEC